MDRDDSLPSPLRQEAGRLLRRAVRSVVAVLLGLATGPLLMLAALLALIRIRRPLAAVDRWDARRLERFARFVHQDPDGAALGPGRALLHGAGSTVLGLVMANLLQQLIVVTLGSLGQLLFGGEVVFVFEMWVVTQSALLVLLIYGPATFLACVGWAEVALWLQARLLRRWFPTMLRADALETRITRLVTTRRGVVVAIDDERRRIERDLHDGVQQNVVSLSVLIARARRSKDPERTAALLDQAHRQSQSLIDEVRQVAWRIHPTALDERGLASALAEVAETCPVPVQLDVQLEERLPGPVESAAYFVAREAVTNVVKHARAESIRIALWRTGAPRRRTLHLSVIDDGIGGADSEGGGLQGLARRVAALDGSVDVHSPPGGPTTITAELPYA
ncbi:sensor histidine kinase [Brachybacterium phenoliresistens]|uniref:histidine kinase n=1 Tax=Brachybacterium phenoliresistens TaxID=396014 RepID=Z9JYA4_9MICO|nr:sensor histidine kinase [Brachybacterium phenoliresistens]EWS82777.1 histidine kinase [Brachybacterium phenoliresistens]